MLFYYVLCAIISYLLGCISTGLLLSQNSGKDIRALGSKSTGATNVSRILGFKMGLGTFAGDFLKGIVAVALTDFFLGRSAAMIAGFFVVAGHNWPLFYAFKGGKGIATSCAVLLYLFPVETLIGMLIAFILIVWLRYVSVGSLTLLATTAILCLIRRPAVPDNVFCLTMFAMGLWQHRKNIERLMNGNENKFSFKK